MAEARRPPQLARTAHEPPAFVQGYLDSAGRGPLAAVASAHGAALAVDASPDGKLLAVGYADGTLALYDRPGGRLLHAVEAAAGPLSHVAFGDGGRQVVAAGAAAEARVWAVRPDGLKAAPPVPLPGPVSCVGLSLGRTDVFLGTDEGTCVAVGGMAACAASGSTTRGRSFPWPYRRTAGWSQAPARTGRSASGTRRPGS